MFRKIVSNLAFSPALVGQLGFYAKRLRGEELTRRLGLVFTALALVVQSFAVFSPPEAANASSPADFVSGGVSSVQGFLNAYDSNSRDIKALFNSLGITRAEIADAKSGTIGQDGYYNWSMTSLYSYAQGQRGYTYYHADGSSKTVYNRPMTLTQEGNPPYPVFIGHSAKFGWFAIKKDCGNLITKTRPPEDQPPTASCKDLNAVTIDRTRVRLDAKAKVDDGAKVKSYTFIVRNAGGKTIEQKEIASNSTSASYTYAQDNPGNYSAVVRVTTSLGVKKDADCTARFTITPPPATPVAVCSSLTAAISNRTNVELSGSATVGGGATISKYTFDVTDAHGKAVAQRVVATNATNAHADAITLSSAGAYSARLTVTTNLGQKTDATNCVEKFNITPPNVCTYNSTLAPTSPDCQPCPGNPSIWIKDDNCNAQLVNSKTATNLTQGVDATTTEAKPGDRISYTVKVENTGTANAKTNFKDSIADVLQYSQLVDPGSGTYNEQTHEISWPETTIQPKTSESRTFMVQLLGALPDTNTGTSDGSSYDCHMTNTFGNSLDVTVTCPLAKTVEQTVGELPSTGPTENMLFAGVVGAVVTFFWARSRQLGRETIAVMLCY